VSRTRLTLAAAAGYALGCVQSADAVARALTGGTEAVRGAGSRNPGTANVARLLGRRAGIAVLAADVAKGAAASVVARALAGDAGAHVGAVAAVAGHCWPATARFDGGKGIATSFGQCVATFPAYAPLDVAVAVGTHRLARATTPALAAAAASSAAWVGAGAVWWRRGLPNLWGPRPTRALPLANAATVAILAARSTQLLLRDRATPA